MANYSKGKKYHFTYKITNLINGRYYLGMHSTNRLKDGYLGSGKRLYYELNKYGKENFKFEILEHFENREDLIQAEKKLITEQDINNSNCLNLKPGGSGGFTKEQSQKGREKTNAILVEKYGKNYGMVIANQWRESLTEEDKKQLSKKISNGLKKANHNHTTFKGKSHTEETKRKIGLANSVKQKGESNSQYGTCWITNEKENKKINKKDTIPEGWRLGRKIKKK